MFGLERQPQWSSEIPPRKIGLHNLIPSTHIVGSQSSVTIVPGAQKLMISGTSTQIHNFKMIITFLKSKTKIRQPTRASPKLLGLCALQDTMASALCKMRYQLGADAWCMWCLAMAPMHIIQTVRFISHRSLLSAHPPVSAFKYWDYRHIIYRYKAPTLLRRLK